MKSTFVLASVLSVAMSPQNTFSASPQDSQQQYLVYIGTYGKGVQGLRFDPSTGNIQSLGLVGEVVNPSWVTTDRDYKHLYAVSELDGKVNGGVASFQIDRQSGKLRALNSVGSAGEAPCFAAVDHTGKTLVVANYSTGGVSSFPIKHDGSLGDAASLMTAQGSSVNKERQKGPHAHEAVISHDNSRVYVPDLGLDQIRIYRLDAATSKLVPNDPPVVKGEPGLGPRHIVFDNKGRFAFLVNEIKPQISVYRHNEANGALEFVQSVPTIPADFTKENTGAEIRLDGSGHFLYASNRGHDSIQVFTVNPDNGTLRPVQTISTQGQEPRGFALDPTGRFLLVGNQKSNNLIVFRVDGKTGELSDTGKHLDIESPVDVLFVPAG